MTPQIRHNLESNNERMNMKNHRPHIRPNFWLIIVSLLIFLHNTNGFSQVNEPPVLKSFTPVVTRPVLSPNGEQILFSGEDYHGLHLRSTDSGDIKTVSATLGAGYRANWSFSGHHIGFKLIHLNGFQQPAIYDVRTGELRTIHPKAAAVGVPTFSRDGRIAYTAGSELFILSKDLDKIFTYEIGHYANLAPISPDGKNIVYNDRNDQLWIIQVADGVKSQITDESIGFFDPKWSPTSDRLIFSSLTGILYTYDLNTGKMFKIDRGSSASWKNADDIVYCRETWDKQFRITASELFLCRYDGSEKVNIQPSRKNIRFPFYSPSSEKLIYLSGEEISIESLQKSGKILHPEINYSIQEFGSATRKEKPNSLQIQPESNIFNSFSFDAPYIHQVYDTPNWFNGHWACGATSAMMALAYYKILPIWPCNCSSPYYHTSDYGRYICEIYSFNGYTYDIPGYDPNYNYAWGGYGFIIQDDWHDTKGNMAKYVSQHGLASSVDWSPTYAKFCDETDQLYPVVILNSLTSSGHYVLGLGYNQTQHSVILNDPYGNKNGGYMNYEGKNVTYDWPGYNSGHANLNIVHCLIYMQRGKDLAISTFDMADTVTVGESIPFETIISNTGFEPVDSASISFYLSPNNYFSENDIFLGKTHLGSFAPVDTQTFSTSLSMPDSLPSKKYALGAFIDKEDAIIETSESNNRAYKVFVLRGYPFVYGFEPGQDATISTSRPQISVRFKDDYFGMLMDSLKLFLDGQNITNQSTISSSKISYTPDTDIGTGTHFVRVEATNNPGFTTIEEWQFDIAMSSVAEKSEFTLKWNLHQNYPNPFNRKTNIQYTIATPGYVTIQIFSIHGKLIKNLVDDFKQEGLHWTAWSGHDNRGNQVTSGLYFYRMKTGTYQETRRLIYIK